MKLIIVCYMSVALVLQMLPIFGQVIRLSHPIDRTYMILPPGTNRATVDVLSQNVTLETNSATGIWQRPDDTNTTHNKIEFPIFTANFAGLYRFYKTNQYTFAVIQIYISVSGSNFAQVSSTGDYTILFGNNIFHTDKTLVCATNDTSQEIQWTYRSTQDTVPTDLTNIAMWDSTNGLSKLEITETEQGYIMCEIPTIYSAALFTQDRTIFATSGMSIVYTKSIDPTNIQLLCTTNDSSIPLNNIRWNVTTPNNNNENPIILNDLNNNNYILNCNGGITTLLSNINLSIQGPPTITLSTTPKPFSSLLPNTNSADIRVLTQNVTLQTNLIGMWHGPDTPPISDNLITHSIFTADLAGVYTFYVNNLVGNQVIAITITIYATGSNFAKI